VKIIVAGSRSIDRFDIVKWCINDSIETLKQNYKVGFIEIVSGGARGVDRLGEQYAKANNLPIKQFIPDWDNQGKVAGFLRNQAMADYADCLIAIRSTGKSNGTDDMIRRANNNNLIVFCYSFDGVTIVTSTPKFPGNTICLK